MVRIAEIVWLPGPEDHDYPAALSYLSLIYEVAVAEQYVAALRAASMSSFKAKDIFRASGLSLLGVSNSHVQVVRRKIKRAAGLSPLLLVRDGAHGKIVVADGYHRLCAVYTFAEDMMVPCRIV